MAHKIEITKADILPMAEYGEIRKESRRKVTEMKRNRRVAIGPDATFYFESYATMFHQIHEMLWIEKGGEAQIADELAAYNPLIPNGHELVATLMFEIDDEVRRGKFLAGLGGVEETVSIAFDGTDKIQGLPEADIDRTNAAGKASAIQFLHFPFTDAQIFKFHDPNVQVTLGISHPKYGHIAILSAETRAALASDFAS
ncbi:MAG: DUF3501 family protein [Rhodospirillales bacterium]|nr:DUF3501 family protein [Rhodospirillales bacterium]